MESLLIKNAKNVDGGSIDICVSNGKITKFDSHLKDVEAEKIIDLHGKSYVSAGWIDDHVHCYEKLSLYYDNPDEVGYKTGVTSVIDAGSTGADNIDDFYNITRSKLTNVFSMINVSKTGILAQDELGDMNRIHKDLVKKFVRKYPKFIVGIKVRESHSVVIDNDVKPLIEGKKIQRENNNLPLMVHVGANPPNLKDVLELMTKGDILTHAFNGKKNGILDQKGIIRDFVWSAYKRGIIFDVGHGTDSFNFNTLEKAKAEGIEAQSLSTDIYHTNRESGPVYNMATCIEKMMLMGYSLKDVIEMITVVPAKNFGLKTKGKIEIGRDADLTIFQINKDNKTLIDSNGNERETNKVVKPQGVVIKGNVYNIEV